MKLGDEIGIPVLFFFIVMMILLVGLSINKDFERTAECELKGGMIIKHHCIKKEAVIW